MLNRPTQGIDSESRQAAEREFDAGAIDLDRLIKAARRQIWVLLCFGVLSLAIGTAYLHSVVPYFRATAVVLIGGTKDKSGLSASIAALTYDSGAIDSQLEVLKSDGTAQTVISKLMLEDASDIEVPRPSLVRRIVDSLRGLVGLDGAAEPAAGPDAAAAAGEESEATATLAKRQALLAQLGSNLDVRRVGRSYVINIDYTSSDRIKAAKIANAFADAYVSDQVEARFQAMRGASDWLEKRISDSKQKSMDADLAVQRFRSEHGLLTADGRLVSDQQIAELTTQIINAQSERAKLEARAAQIRALIEANDVNGVVSGTLDSPLINDLRRKYIAATQLSSEIVASYGATHLQAVNLQRSMEEYTRLIFGEMKRMAAAYESDAAIALSNENSQRKTMAALAADSYAKAQDMVELRELQRQSESYRTLYSAFLARMQQIQEGQPAPDSEARIITPASAPLFPTYPKRGVVIALSLFFGLVAGVTVGAVREFRDKTFRTAADVKDELGLEFLGMLPVVKPAPPPPGRVQLETIPELTDPTNPFLRYATDNPLTSFTETLRTIKVAVDLQLEHRKTKVLGIVSLMPDEGKSTVSKNFASLVAHLGSKVLLIDGDIRHRTLSTELAGHAEVGLLEVISGEAQLESAVMRERDSGLYFLPVVANDEVLHPSQILQSTEMQDLLAKAHERFEYVVFDLPPIGAVVDVRAAAGMFDAFVFVVRWGHSEKPLVAAALAADKAIVDRCVGVVYNRVNLGKIKMFENSDVRALHMHALSKYYSS